MTPGVAIKAPCLAASTANLTLSGEQTVDGVHLITGNRVLVKNQTAAVNNGIYEVDTSSWERTKDFDGTNDVVTGTLVYVINGSSNIGTFWQITNTGTVNPGTTALAFAIVNNALAGVTAFMQTLLAAVTASAARATLGIATTTSSVTSNYTTIPTDSSKVLQCVGTFSITLGDAATMGAGWFVNIVNAGSGTITIARLTGGNTLAGAASNITLAPLQAMTVAVNQATNGFNLLDGNSLIFDSTDPTKQVRFNAGGLTTGTTRVVTAPDYDIRLGNFPAGIGPLPYSGSSIPTGWLACDGSAVSRTTYAALFTAISTTWGTGDGSTTFNLPDMRGRVPIGDGTGTLAEACTTTSGNGFAVVSNATKWNTGQAVVLSGLTGFTTTATAGPTYYVTRISATNIRLATTLALAQAGTPDITISGTGTVTVTGTLTARTLGQNGGEESHAMSSAELLSHTHTMNFISNAFGQANTSQVATATGSTNLSNTGGNAAMNIMQPFIVTKYIISY